MLVLIPSAVVPIRFPVNPARHFENIAKARKRTYKKKQNHPEGSPEIAVQCHAEKR